MLLCTAAGLLTMFLIALIALGVSLYTTIVLAIERHPLAALGHLCGVLTALYALLIATIWLPF